MSKRLTTEGFIERAKKLHGDKYSYDEVEYKTSHDYVKIFCIACNKYYIQKAYSHLNGIGCNSCGIKRRADNYKNLGLKHFNCKDITNKKFGRLRAIKIIDKYLTTNRWLCKCDCGEEVNVPVNRLLSGTTKSCGCLQRELTSHRVKTHGYTITHKNLYSTWGRMINRCHNSKDLNFHHYGGRGIFVCLRWLFSVENFIKDMGEKPSKDYSIERLNNRKGYNPKNCIWATQKQQHNNQRTNIKIKYKNRIKTLAEWCEELKLPYGTMRRRITDLGWSAEKAFTTKIKRAERFFYKGKDRVLSEIAIMVGINPVTLRNRITRWNWSLEKAVSEPVRSQYATRKK